MAKVTGIGGVFFKCKDPKATNEWYKTNFGMDVGPYGVHFEWGKGEDGSNKGSTAWNTFPDSADYFDPSEKDYMINYRVDDLEALVKQLKKDGVVIVDEIETYDYGKFVHVIDLEGNKVELWEPTD